MRKLQHSRKNAPSGRPKSLYRALTIALVVLVSSVSITVNLLNYVYFSRQAEALYESKSSEYAGYLRDALEWPLWNVDDELIAQIGGAFASNAEIVLLTIRDDRQRVVYHKQKPNGNLIKKEIAIEHNGQKIGTVEIALTLSVYEERDRQLLLASIATTALLILVLLAATRWLLARLLRKPVEALVGATGDMVEGKYREIELPETYKEFSSILAGFKTMSDTVASRESRLQQINARLSAEIAERKHAESERKWAEEQLRAVSHYTRSLIEASLDPLVTISPEGKITDVNRATEKVTGRNRSELIGTDFSDYFTEPARAREGYQKVFEKGAVTDYPLAIRHHNGHVADVLYNASVYHDEAGNVLGVFAAARDITERKQNEAVKALQLHLVQFALTHSLDEVLEETLNESEKLTGSLIGFYHFVENDQNTLTLQSWSTRTKTVFCQAEGQGMHYPVAEAGVWADCVRQCKAVIHNDYAALPDRKGMPEGHAAVVRELVVPVLRGNRLVAILGVGNKPADYTEKDVEIVSLIADLVVEIAERKRAEEQLRRSQHGLAEAQRIAHLGNWELDIVHDVLTWSDEIFRIFEIDADKFGASYEDFLEAIHPDDRDRVNNAYTASVKNKAPYDIVHRLLMKDGRVKYVNEKCESYYDAEGKPLRSVGTVHDITERYRAEQEVLQLSLQNRLILDSAGEGIYGLDSDGRCTFANPAALQMLGFSADELLGQSSHALFHHTMADGRPYPGEACPVQAAYKQGVVHRGEDLYWCKDGSRFAVDFVSTPILEAGKTTGAVVIFNDITERKRAEEKLRVSEERLHLAAFAGNIGVWDWNVVNNDLIWDESMYDLYGISKEHFQGVYDAWARTLHPEDRQYVEGEIQAALHGEREYAPEFRVIRADGSVRVIKAASKTYFDASAKPLRMIGTNIDITERKQAEEELRRYKDHLEEVVQQRTADLVLARNAAEAANKAKSVFLANMSHELRTPLNAILGFSGMMRKETLLTEEQRDNLDIINRSGEHLLTLINDVLEMAKIEAGRVQLENVPFDLGALVRDVIDMMQIRAQEKGLQLLVDQDSDFPRFISGDQARLRQILINLVGNALKFTRQGGVTVRLGVLPHAVQPRLLIEVEDSGIGIKPEDLQKIFEPFVQLGQAATQKGTGLGLTITRQFVQLMGGTIAVESTLGAGTIFRVELPVETAAAADTDKTGGDGLGDVIGLLQGQPEYRILIAEDQLENQLLLVRLMKKIGFPVKVAENGEQAVAVFESWRPHLIWMDRRMPVMDGMEAARRVRGLPGGKDVKIVAVTASAFKEQRDEMLNAGMDDFVRKPYRFNEIYACLSKQLGVQFMYAGAEPAEEAENVTLTPEMLAVLPAELRSELRDALESLESKRIADVMRQVLPYDAALHKILSHLIGNFDYPAILKALQMHEG